MKNIHILNTEQESNLYTWENSLRFGGITTTPKNLGLQNQFIYITNDEALTLDGYHFNSKYGDEPQKTVQRDIDSRKYWEEDSYSILKIILTNDPQLIKDGVQALDEEFLQWYVNNSSCEFVSVKHCLVNSMGREVNPLNLGQNHSSCVWKYFITIPRENIVENWLGKHGKKEINKEVKMEAEKYSKLISEFERLEGITSNQFTTKEWNRFDRFVENREKEDEEDFNNKDNWEFDISSGYAGYRNTITHDWIYEKGYVEKFGVKETAEEETLEKIKFVLSANNSSQAIRFIEQYGFWRDEKAKQNLFNITLEAVNLGMTLRQNQLNGFSSSSGNEVHKEWFERLNK